MIYTSVSVKPVIGKLIRNTRLKDSSYLDDILEWLPEAMGMLRTSNELIPAYETLQIRDHSAKLPCGILVLDAVEYEGYRLREGSSQTHVKHPPAMLNSTNGSIFIPNTDVTIENHLDVRVSGSDLEEIPFNSGADFYKLQLDYIQTSFEEGEVVIYFHKMPVDIEGYPLIPDNENYKEALYWYMLMKMIEAGYEHHLFKWDHCWNMWENVYARRAINEITYPSIDRMERILKSSVRLIPPQHFYTDFFMNAEQYQDVNGL